MKLAKRILEGDVVIIPDDNSTDVAFSKKYAKSLQDLTKSLEKFSNQYDGTFIKSVDESDYRMYHDAKRLIRLLSGQGKEMIDLAKEGKSFKIDKITRDKNNK